MSKDLLIGNRVPRDFFETRGHGESDITVHAGSFHLALKSAGIEVCNIMTYSSILPGVAKLIDKPHHFVHGEVMESIMAVANASQGERATAGIIYAWLYNKQTGEKFGGLVCEHNGNYTKEEIIHKLESSLKELYINGFEDTHDLSESKILIESFVPQKDNGTALVALCFTNYLYPVLE